MVEEERLYYHGSTESAGSHQQMDVFRLLFLKAQLNNPGRIPENCLSQGAGADLCQCCQSVTFRVGFAVPSVGAGLGELLPGLGCHSLGSTPSKGVSRLCLSGSLRGASAGTQQCLLLEPSTVPVSCSGTSQVPSME